ncbi:hypothetical protein MasN3_31830 [Massilia varians]|uniref:diguanylate cyclase n=2 Tax=Massilia varians TaxID=457921 RepID=A0ABM8C8T7_9BURK|nr:hypothetical protein MasN3_31830 [Massilia varians]
MGIMTIKLAECPPVSCDDPGVYRTLLESSKTIPWRIDWATMRFTYIGPQIEALTGFMFDITARKQAEDKILQLQRELELLSYRDSLTGVANRRMFDTLYPVEWAKAQATGEPLSLLVVDVDYFKQYNDYYGHMQGDECLRQVAAALDAGASRSRDLCARLGGEEFVLLLPATDAQAARNVAERCRRLLAQKELPHARSGVGRLVTVSIGAGTIVPGKQDRAEVFLDRIDRRLYQAKSAGRDQVCDSEA